MDYQARTIRTITDPSEIGVGVGDHEGVVYVYVSLPHTADRNRDDQWVALSLDCASDLYGALHATRRVFRVDAPVPKRPVTVPAGDLELLCDEALRDFNRCREHGAPWTKEVHPYVAGAPLFCDLCAPADAVDGMYARVVRVAVRLREEARAVL